MARKVSSLQDYNSSSEQMSGTGHLTRKNILQKEVKLKDDETKTPPEQSTRNFRVDDINLAEGP